MKLLIWVLNLCTELEVKKKSQYTVIEHKHVCLVAVDLKVMV